MSGRAVLAVAFAFATASSARAWAGTVQSVTPSPPASSVGHVVSVTVAGTNPCGAAYVDWGDGTAITYAITGLPTSQSHTYQQRGRYRLIARGMGNCDGEAAATVEISGPPPPDHPNPPNPRSGRVTAVTFSSVPAIARMPVTIAVDGDGVCALSVHFGDGNQQDFGGALPKRIAHTYGAPGTYRVIVGPVAPCTGKFTETLQVVAQGGVSITGIDVAPSPALVRQGVTITVLGAGTCGYTIDFGDGNSEERTKALPDSVAHVYSAPDSYAIHVQAVTGCKGAAHRALTVTPR